MTTIVDGDGGEDGAPYERLMQAGDGVLTVGGSEDGADGADGDEDPASEALGVEVAERRLVDARVYEMLHTAGFDGPRWTSFTFKHGKHALGMFDRLIASGEVFVLSAGIGHPVANNDELAREVLRRDELHRQALANKTVYLGLKLWQKRQGDPRQAWRADGGASLATSVINSCIYSFSNAFRNWRPEAFPRIPQSVADHEELGKIEYGIADRDKPLPMFPDPLLTVVTDDLLTRALDCLDDEVVVRIAQLHAQGVSYEEIGQEVDRTRRQVEYVLNELLPRRIIRSRLEGEQP
jgi:hypothetical protein